MYLARRNRDKKKYSIHFRIWQAQTTCMYVMTTLTILGMGTLLTELVLQTESNDISLSTYVTSILCQEPDGFYSISFKFTPHVALFYLCKICWISIRRVVVCEISVSKFSCNSYMDIIPLSLERQSSLLHHGCLKFKWSI